MILITGKKAEQFKEKVNLQDRLCKEIKNMRNAQRNHLKEKTTLTFHRMIMCQHAVDRLIYQLTDFERN